MLSRCIQAEDVMKARLESACAASPPSPNTSQTTNIITPFIHNIKPTSECKSLPSVFASGKDSTFDLKCGIDLDSMSTNTKPDLVGVYVYTFTDCVNACAIFNDRISTGGHSNWTCYAVSFNFALAADEGNCWLKGYQNLPFHRNETVDTAILQTS